MPPSVSITQSPAAQRTKKTPASIKRTKGKSAASVNGAATRKKFRNVEDSSNVVNSAPQDESDAALASANTSAAAAPMEASNPLNSSSLLGSTGMYGGAYGGMNMMGSPYYSSYGFGGGMMPGIPGQPFSGLNQFLFSIQSVIFSLGQAVQILGMNTQALHQLLDTASTMFDHALSTWKEMRTLEAAAAESESEEDKKRRRRLRALRWAVTVGVSYAVFKLIRRFLLSRRRRNGRRFSGDGIAFTDNRSYGGMYEGQHVPPGHGALTGPGYSGNGYGSSYDSSAYGGSPFSNNRYGPHGGGPYGYGGGFY